LTADARLTRRVVVTRRPTHLKQLTIRGFDPDVAEEVRELARRERLSLNQAVMQLLRRAAGRHKEGDARAHRVGSSLDDLAGTWSERDEKEFARAIEPLERIDEAFWGPSTRRARRRR
jgi:hypothetical protein